MRHRLQRLSLSWRASRQWSSTLLGLGRQDLRWCRKHVSAHRCWPRSAAGRCQRGSLFSCHALKPILLEVLGPPSAEDLAPLPTGNPAAAKNGAEASRPSSHSRKAVTTSSAGRSESERFELKSTLRWNLKADRAGIPA